MFKTDYSVTTADTEWYRVPGGDSGMSKGTRCNRSRTSGRTQVNQIITVHMSSYMTNN